MIPIVCDLVVHFPGSRIHAVQPIQSPFDLVHDVGNAIRSRSPVGIIGIAKGFGMSLVGKEHLVDGIGRGGGVLQVVGGIVPAARYVDGLATLGRVINDVAIVGVATVLQEGVVAATLLAHILQDKVGCPLIDRRADREVRRDRFPGSQVIGACGCEIAEIQPIDGRHAAIRRGGLRG